MLSRNVGSFDGKKVKFQFIFEWFSSSNILQFCYIDCCVYVKWKYLWPSHSDDFAEIELCKQTSIERVRENVNNIGSWNISRAEMRKYLISFGLFLNHKFWCTASVCTSCIIQSKRRHFTEHKVRIDDGILNGSYTTKFPMNNRQNAKKTNSSAANIREPTVQMPANDTHSTFFFMCSICWRMNL